jgi:S1-C subfamily serine protease
MMRNRSGLAGTLLALVTVSSLLAQTSPPPLVGFRFARIDAPRYGDGSVDPMGLAPYMGNILASQGFTLVPATVDLTVPAARDVASQLLECGIGHDAEGFSGTSATLRCTDVLGYEVVRITEKGSGFSHKADLEGALRKIGQRLQKLRPGFDPRQAVDLLQRLPGVETRAITEALLEEMAVAGKLLHPLEGTWAAADETGYRLGIVSENAGRDFVAVIFESPRNFLWQAGMVKGYLTAAAAPGAFVAKWRMGNRDELSGLASLTGSVLTVSVTREGKEDQIRFVKLRSAVAGSDAAKAAETPTLGGSGTGFFCAPGIVATNFHVIDGAKSVSLYLPAQNRTVALSIAVSDSANDLALLSVMESERRDLPPALQLGDSMAVKLGSEAIAIGFPMGDDLGPGHKVTSGLVSALEGPSGDPRLFQLTAPIQPGSSGSPLLDSQGRVIGVVTATLDALAVARNDGHVPQNVNFAVKSDYLALLVRRLPQGAALAPAGQGPKVALTTMVDKARLSVGHLRVYR